MTYDYSSDIKVTLVSCVGDDRSIAAAARVSTIGDDSLTQPQTEESVRGLIRYLMRERHGSPFEHNMFTFLVTAPIFVWREHMRHRIGFSYNEESGRYKQLDPHFYIPAPDRALVQTGKPGAYEFSAGTPQQIQLVNQSLKAVAAQAYDTYKVMLFAGVAREVARMVLPVNIYSSAYVTCNARSLMAFLSLRTHNESAHWVSHPQREIELVAEQYENALKSTFPFTHEAFVDFGRVSP